MNMLKKLFSLCLALTLLLSLAVPAMADSKTYTITIRGSQENLNIDSQKDHTYQAYQILRGTMMTKEETDSTTGEKYSVTYLGDIEWGTGINGAAFLTALKENTSGVSAIFANVTTAQQFAEEISKTTFDSEHLKIVAGILNKHLTGSYVEASECMTDTAGKPYYELSVGAGYYLIKDEDHSLAGGTNKDYTNIILRVAENVTVYHKGSIPSVEKNVSEAGVTYSKYIAIAHETEYYYQLIGYLPSDITNYSEYKFEFVDTLAPGIDYVSQVSATLVHTEAGTTEDISAGLVVTEPNENADGKLRFTFSNLIHEENKHHLQSNDKIVIVYKAKLNKDAVVGGDGNKNRVHIAYSNNPQDTTRMGQTNDDTTTVYTYGLMVNKIPGEAPTQKLKNVTFVLYRMKTKTQTEPVDVNTPGAQATIDVPEYAVVEDNKIIAWTENDQTFILPTDENGKEIGYKATILTTGDDGTFYIEGLDSNVTYYMKELATNPGYNTIKEPITIFLTGALDNAGTSIGSVNISDNQHFTIGPNYTNTVTTDGSTATKVAGAQVSVINYRGNVLPSTGGIGTTIFYIAGAMMVLGAIALLVTKKRMN